MNIKTPFGDLFYLSVNGVLQKISWQPIVSGERNIELEMQVTAFFNRELKLFFLPLKLDVPAFSQKVLIAAQSIPFGQVMTYSEIAQMIDEAGKARAVANALKHNPYALVIPCHRVVNQNGKSTGYFGNNQQMLTLRQKLLAFEIQQ